MAENSKIEWCDHTINLWWGCAKVHTGCKNCYAEKTANRFGDSLWGEKTSRRIILSAFKDLDKYQRTAVNKGRPQIVFVGSMMDIFEDPKPLVDKDGNAIMSLTTNGKVQMNTSHIRNLLFDLISRGKFDNLIFLFLTKRPENITRFTPEIWQTKCPPNVWFGTSVSDQETWSFAENLKAVPFGHKFISCEPQTGMVNGVDLSGISWMIQGGESGPRRRGYDIDWAFTMQKTCFTQGVPYFFKQIDKVQPIPKGLQQRQFPTCFNVN